MTHTRLKSIGPPRILAVDDHEANRYTLGKLLSKAGFQVVVASSGQEALDRLAEQRPDLIILDVHLPDISGLEVCRKIKSEPGNASIAIMHLSASLVTPRDRTVGLEGGADAYLVEPVDPEELVATIRALLRQKGAEERARSAAREWRTTFDAIQDGIAVTDSEGLILRCNRALSELLNRPFAELLGRPLQGLLAKRFELSTLEPLKGLLDPSERHELQIAWGERWFRITVDPIVQGRKVRGATTIVSEITAQKQSQMAIELGKEELRRLNEHLEERVHARTGELQAVIAELEAFSYTIAHDLRSPLRAMHRFGELLLEDYGASIGGEGQEYIRRIMGSAHRMDRLIQDLLVYSRLSQAPLRLERIRVREMVEELVCQEFHGEGEMMLEETLPDAVADGVLLRQVFRNLISNAVKFVRPGRKPRVRILGALRGNRVRYTVDDEGIGIPDASRDKLFRVFERLVGTKEYSGTGIGLAIVRRAMERMGGTYGVESREGVGSSFWIELPLGEARP